jgi:hypothetical protein
MSAGERPFPLIALRADQAAAALAVSRDFFDAEIAHELRSIRRGRVKLYPVKELERWLDENAEQVLP